MSISTATLSVPRKYESLKNLIANFTLDFIDGRLASFVSPQSQGYIVAFDLAPNGTGTGRIHIVDGNAQVVLDVPAASIFATAGPKEGPWTTLEDFKATGLSVGDIPYAFRTVGTDPGDDNSLIVEMGVESSAGLAATFNVLKWALRV